MPWLILLMCTLPTDRQCRDRHKEIVAQRQAAVARLFTWTHLHGTTDGGFCSWPAQQYAWRLKEQIGELERSEELVWAVWWVVWHEASVEARWEWYLEMMRLVRRDNGLP